MTTTTSNHHLEHKHPTGKPPSERSRTENRFFEKVDYERVGEDECWMWTASTTNAGYGHFWTHDGMDLAHRVAYELLVGEINGGDEYDGSVQINHHCDKPGCVNPRHLYRGTQEQNVKDSLIRGNRETKLSADDVRDIRDRYEADADDVTLADLADDHGVSDDMIHRIATGKSYAYIS